MPDSTSNLSVDEQQTVAHQEHEALITVVAATLKNLDRHGRESVPPPWLGRRRRPSPVTWTSSSPLSKRSRYPRTTTTII
jgi:hypothetical protein